MFKGLANLGSLMKQAQQMGGKIGALNDQLRTKRAHGSSGGGMVQVEVNGLGEVLRLTIDPKLIENNERDMIEDLVPAAINQAIQRSKELYFEALKTLTDGIPFPGLEEAMSKLAGNSEL